MTNLSCLPAPVFRTLKEGQRRSCCSCCLLRVTCYMLYVKMSYVICICTCICTCVCTHVYICMSVYMYWLWSPELCLSFLRDVCTSNRHSSSTALGVYFIFCCQCSHFLWTMASTVCAKSVNLFSIAQLACCSWRQIAEYGLMRVVRPGNLFVM